MWTLLCAMGSGRGDATEAESVTSEPAPVNSGRVAANGTPVLNGAMPTSAENGKVRLFMCPGRTEIGLLDLRQAAAQFDFASARRFRSLAEADPVCAQKTGFLLELQRGGARNGAREVLFVEGLRG